LTKSGWALGDEPRRSMDRDRLDRVSHALGQHFERADVSRPSADPAMWNVLAKSCTNRAAVVKDLS